MLDKIQFLLSLQIIGFCIFAGVTLLLRAQENRAKLILGGGMLLWAVLVAVRLSVNIYISETKEVFHPYILITGCLVMASLACYVIEVLRPGYLTLKRFFIFIAPVFLVGLFYFIYRLSGGNAFVFYSLYELFEYCSLDVVLRLFIFVLTLFYMFLPAVLVMLYSKEFKAYLYDNVSDPEDYDLDWLKKAMIMLSVMYVFYLILLLTNVPLLYVIDKVSILIIWYYLFYKALFLKVINLDYSFEKGWRLPRDRGQNGDDGEQPNFLSRRYAEEVHAWFEKEKPYLREDLRLTDLQRIFPISRSYLSQVFNRELGQSFSDYVNQFRIEESRRIMESEPLTSIQEVAERSGFHSISTFRRAFLKYTGTIPSEYKKG